METEPSKPRAKDPRLGAKNRGKPREGSRGSKAQAGSRESVGNDSSILDEQYPPGPGVSTLPQHIAENSSLLKVSRMPGWPPSQGAWTPESEGTAHPLWKSTGEVDIPRNSSWSLLRGHFKEQSPGVTDQGQMGKKLGEEGKQE